MACHGVAMIRMRTKLKCSATVVGLDLILYLSTERQWSSNLSLRLFCLVSPMNCKWHCLQLHRVDRLNFAVTILQVHVSFHISRSMYYATAVGTLKRKKKEKTDFFAICVLSSFDITQYYNSYLALTVNSKKTISKL